MKKLMSAAVAAVLTLSLSACRADNTAIENRNNGITNDGTNPGTAAGLENRNNGVNGGINLGRTTGAEDNAAGNTDIPGANYKDGAYIGFGNGHVNGNEKAIVVVRNGRVADIYLSSVSQQEANEDGNVADDGDRAERDTGSGAENEGGYRNQPGAGVIPGTRPGVAIGNTAGHELDNVRSNLVNAMIQNQSANVNVTTNNNIPQSTINNWKLAVSRALDQARR